MTFDELEHELGRNVLRPAYLLAGAEMLYRDDSRKALRTAVVGTGREPFSHDLLRGEVNSPGELIDSVRTLPVFGGQRLVELIEPESRRPTSGGMREVLVEILEDLLSLGDAGTCVFVVSAARVDRRSAWFRCFRAPAAVVTCDAPKGIRATVGFVRAEAKRQQVSLSPGAAEALAERTGVDLLALRQDIAKVALYAGEGESLTTAHVVEAVSDLSEKPIWGLTDAIGEGLVGDALRALDRMLGTGAVPQVLLGVLASHFRKLLRLRSGGEVGGPPFLLKKLSSQARRYTVRDLELGIRGIWAADEELKGVGSLPPPLVLERLIILLSK